MKKVLDFRKVYRQLKEIDLWEIAFVCYDVDTNELILFTEDRDNIMNSGVLYEKGRSEKVVSIFTDVTTYDRMVNRIFYDLKKRNTEWSNRIIHEMERRFPYLEKMPLKINE